MLIDCDSCVARGVRCAGCVVTVMFADAAPRPAARGADPGGAPATQPRWDAQELRALGVLADAGLLPPVGSLTGAVLDRIPRERAAGDRSAHDRAVHDHGMPGRGMPGHGMPGHEVLDRDGPGPAAPARRVLPPRRAG
ncbi:hypothetical protein [Frankia sp. AgKG'84/4]